MKKKTTCPFCVKRIKKRQITDDLMECKDCGVILKRVLLTLKRPSDYKAYTYKHVIPKYSKDKKPIPFTEDMINGVKIDKVFLAGKQINLLDVEPTGKILLGGKDNIIRHADKYDENLELIERVNETE